MLPKGQISRSSWQAKLLHVHTRTVQRSAASSKLSQRGVCALFSLSCVVGTATVDMYKLAQSSVSSFPSINWHDEIMGASINAQDELPGRMQKSPLTIHTCSSGVSEHSNKRVRCNAFLSRTSEASDCEYIKKKKTDLTIDAEKTAP